MKKILFSILALLAIATTAGAQRGVAINSTNFPSTNFRKFVKDNYDKDGDNFLSDAEIAAVTKINVYGKSIGDLKGIERFTALKELDCRKNGLLELDLSKNTALTRLICSANNLGSLDLSKNTALTELECSENQLESLDLSKNTALNTLWCDINKIKGLNMRKLVKSLPTVSRGTLGVIDTKSSNEQNVITSPQVAIAKDKGWSVLDLNGGSSYIPYAGIDPGFEINATNFPDDNFRSYVLDVIDGDEDGYLSDAEIAAVTRMEVYYKKIANLTGIEHFTALKRLHFHDNQLKSLDVSKNTALTELECYNNQLTSLDVSKNTKLEKLSCWDNQLTSLNVSGCTALERLNCYKNQLTSLNVSGCTALKFLECNNNQLTSLDVSKNTALISLFCENNQLTSLDVSKNTSLGDLRCNNNQLTSLDVSNTRVRDLRCYSNQIKGAAMLALVNSLPWDNFYSSRSFLVIDTADSNEGNVITKSQVAIAKGKNWKVYNLNASYAHQLEYEGSDDTPTSIGTNNRETITNNDWYTIDGVKLNGEPTRKGVYIYKGRKVVK